MIWWVLPVLYYDAMRFQEIKDQALGLDIRQRIALVQELLGTLDVPAKKEIIKLWVEEAERRYDLHLQDKIPVILAEEIH